MLGVVGYFAATRADVRWGTRTTRLTTIASWAWLTAIVFTGVGLFTLSERWLPFTLLLYGPRWVVLLPLAVLVPLVLFSARRAILPLVLGGWVALVPIMGLRWTIQADQPLTLHPVPPTLSDDNVVRVMTLNAQGGEAVSLHLDDALARYAPSALAFQECGEAFFDRLSLRRGWNVARVYGMCVMSQWPITAQDTMPRAAFARVAELGLGGAAHVVRFTIAHPHRPFELVTLHLETARKGLSLLLGAEGVLNDQTGMPQLPRSTDLNRVAANAEIRMRESERAAYWSARRAADMPVIVMGDFNMPVESSIYRRYWRTLTNAFEAKGTGFGFTKQEGTWIRIRIDHVLAAPAWFTVQGAWVGEDVGSDHRPVIVDLAWRDSK